MSLSNILPVSVFDHVTKSGNCVVVLMDDFVGVVLVALNFGTTVVDVELATGDEDDVIIGFFFWGGVGLVPLDVIIVDWMVVANLDGEVFVGPGKLCIFLVWFSFSICGKKIME